MRSGGYQLTTSACSSNLGPCQLTFQAKAEPRGVSTRRAASISATGTETHGLPLSCVGRRCSPTLTSSLNLK